jgi:cell division protein ZapA (FtsZ GTPase activity inhibitor)
MKNKYTVTIADVEMNILSEESPETVEAVVGIVDRKIREINQKSRRCSKNEAALLCAMDYCADKTKAQRKIKALETRLAHCSVDLETLEAEQENLRADLETLEAENAALRRKLEALKEQATGGNA